MYWRVPETTQVKVKTRQDQCYCFVPAKLVSRLRSAETNHFGQQMLCKSVAKTLRDRSIVYNLF
ncbi:hypothetical protein EOPP23_11905 [Endozoicomonas sp. OPT23]|nr:hypothetical protein [Endozoicomonas sp. OPT23]